MPWFGSDVAEVKYRGTAREAVPHIPVIALNTSTTLDDMGPPPAAHIMRCRSMLNTAHCSHAKTPRGKSTLQSL
jgi:hypothetical protein